MCSSTKKEHGGGHSALVVRKLIQVAFTRRDDKSENLTVGESRRECCRDTPVLGRLRSEELGWTRRDARDSAIRWAKRSPRPASAIEDVDQSAREIKPVGLLSIARNNEHFKFWRQILLQPVDCHCQRRIALSIVVNVALTDD